MGWFSSKSSGSSSSSSGSESGTWSPQGEPGTKEKSGERPQSGWQSDATPPSDSEVQYRSSGYDTDNA